MLSSMPEGIFQVNDHRNIAEKHHLAMPSRAIGRYRDLARQLLAEGMTQKDVGTLLEISQSYVSKLVDKNRTDPEVTADLIELAINKLRLNPAYFYGAFPQPPRYKDLQRISKLPEMGYPAFFQFMNAREASGQKITQEEREALQRQEWDGDPTVDTYNLFLMALRTVQAPEVTVVRPLTSRPERSADKQRKRPGAS